MRPVLVATLLVTGILCACQNQATAIRVAPAGAPAIHPPPLRILVLGDGFTDQNEFNTVAAAMTAALLGLPGGSSIDVRTKMASLSTGIKHQGNCFFDADGTAQTNVRNEAPFGFDAQRYLVIMKLNVAAAEEGCSYGDVAIVAADAYVNTVRHEMGHSLAGLYDERGSMPDAPL